MKNVETTGGNAVFAGLLETTIGCASAVIRGKCGAPVESAAWAMRADFSSNRGKVAQIARGRRAAHQTSRFRRSRAPCETALQVQPAAGDVLGPQHHRFGQIGRLVQQGTIVANHKQRLELTPRLQNLLAERPAVGRPV